MENQSEEQYLPEDKDLLDEMEKIGPPSTGTSAMGQLNKLLSLQIKAMLRSRKAETFQSMCRKTADVMA